MKTLLIPTLTALLSTVAVSSAQSPIVVYDAIGNLAITSQGPILILNSGASCPPRTQPLTPAFKQVQPQLLNR